LGPTNDFITFPANVVNIDFATLKGAKSVPLVARTDNGFAVTVSFSFQYKLIKSEVPELYKLYSQRYEENFIRIARGAVTEASSNFSSYDYWNKRAELNLEYQSSING
jgi:hypothetical protein